MVAPEMQSRRSLSVDASDLTEEDLRWSAVPLSDVIERGRRLEASVFGIEGRHARKVIQQCKWPQFVVAGDHGLAEAYHRPRFKRIWIAEGGTAIFQPSQIREVYPRPNGYISSRTKTDIAALRVRKGQILMTCSGTIGLCSLVADTLDGEVFSHDVIRITCRQNLDTGYLYAFLLTRTGNALVRTNEYGAVVSHIEPEHLESVPIPEPPEPLKKKIHGLIVKSYALRDESNLLLDEAEQLLYDALTLPPLDSLRPRYFAKTLDLRNYSVSLSTLAGRLDGSYHVPIVDAIVDHLKKTAAEVTSIEDPRISTRVILPGRFARVYVQEGQGVPFFGGKQLLELDPANKKYLSLKHHGERIRRELKVEENMILITRSGTIGKVVLVPSHWSGWIPNEHIIRVKPTSDEIAGYLYVFLSTDYGRELISRFTYGAVVDEIDDRHVCKIPVPLPRDSSKISEISQLALTANNKRTQAYNLEQDAIRITDEDVIHG